MYTFKSFSVLLIFLLFSELIINSNIAFCRPTIEVFYAFPEGEVIETTITRLRIKGEYNAFNSQSNIQIVYAPYFCRK